MPVIGHVFVPVELLVVPQLLVCVKDSSWQTVDASGVQEVSVHVAVQVLPD